MTKKTAAAGFTFIELLVAVAVVTLFFGGLIVSLQYALKLIANSKAAAGAHALANERLEYIRSLDYNDVGTVSGIPNGPIPQNATTTLNGIVYTERVLVQYVDAPEDGFGAADTNGILADYKQVKIEYSWQTQTGTSSMFLLTNVVPVGIESVAGGGTLKVNVFDAAVQPLAGAEVHVYNDTTTSTIDVTTYTNVDGIAYFAGAPAAANYQITVTSPGYSTDQTYSASSTNPNPSPPHVAVLESLVSTMNFQIDQKSDLLVRTVGPSTDGSFDDDFVDVTGIASSSNIAQSGSEILLAGGAGSYASQGVFFAGSTTPAVITGWDTFSFTASSSASTTALVSLYTVTGTSTYTLVPDGDLPGNAAGFGSSPVDISMLDEGTYPTLALGATLATIDSNVSPEIDAWSLHYIVSEPAISDVSFTMQGHKTIGTTATASPVYKYDWDHITDGSGELQLSGLEWDTYTFTINSAGYDISEACNTIPYVLLPNVDETLTLTLVPDALYSIRVVVEDGSGNPILDADVDLTRSGFSASESTSSCGQAFFNSGLGAYADYQVQVSKSGFTTETVTDVTISGDESLRVILSAT